MPTTSPTLSLRPFATEDVAFFSTMAVDERVTRFIGDGSPWDEDTIQSRTSAAIHEDPIGAIGASRWFLASEEDVPVGIVVSTRKESGIEIGYWVSPDHWGRGIAGTMLDSALARIPDVYETKHLLARVAPGNVASAKLLTRRGFQLTSHIDGLDHYTVS